MALTVCFSIYPYLPQTKCFCVLAFKDKSVEGPKPVKISKGIPQSFMVKAEPDAKGAMLTSTGEYAIPAIDAYVSNIDRTHTHTHTHTHTPPPPCNPFLSL